MLICHTEKEIGRWIVKMDCGWIDVACVGFDIGQGNLVDEGMCRKKGTTNLNRVQYFIQYEL